MVFILKENIWNLHKKQFPKLTIENKCKNSKLAINKVSHIIKMVNLKKTIIIRNQ
jgi:hypothetical protein